MYIVYTPQKGFTHKLYFLNFKMFSSVEHFEF